MKKLYLLCPLLLLLASCYHKDISTGKADDVVYSEIYKGKEGTFIITMERVFQTDSKSSDNGGIRKSGFSEFRLTSYDITTGKVISRVDLGPGEDENQTIILGMTEGKLWLYSLNESLGLHIRNPKTLEVLLDQEKLSQTPSLKSIVLNQPKWRSLKKYFGFDIRRQKVIISDQQENKYYMDPLSFALEKTLNKIPNNDHTLETNSASGEAFPRSWISLKGDSTRDKELWFGIGNHIKKSKLTFIDGRLFDDYNPLKDAALRKLIADSLRKQIGAMTDTMKQLAKINPAVSIDEWTDGMNKETSDAHLKHQHLKMITSRYETEVKRLEDKDHEFGLRLFPLLTEDNWKSCFVLHATNLTDTAHAIISKIIISSGDSSFSEAWKTTMPDFYRDGVKAKKAGAFDAALKEDNPRFYYNWQGVADGKLVLISQVRMACLDAKTGKILWDIHL